RRSHDMCETIEVLERGMPIVHGTARKVARLGAVDYAELVSLGIVTVLDAAREHDPERAALEPFLAARLHWAMMSQVRARARRWRILNDSAAEGRVPCASFLPCPRVPEQDDAPCEPEVPEDELPEV